MRTVTVSIDPAIRDVFYDGAVVIDASTLGIAPNVDMQSVKLVSTDAKDVYIYGYTTKQFGELVSWTFLEEEGTRTVVVFND